MPELPEVETVRQGLIHYCLGQSVRHIVVRQPKLRWPIPNDLETKIRSQKLTGIDRRGKYLLLRFPPGTVLIHLGMSGVLRIHQQPPAVSKHDHVDIVLDHTTLRFHDPRRFGCILWVENTDTHPLLSKIGIEPLSVEFDADYLFQHTKKRSLPLKSLLMNNQIVTGIGNIYCNELLFATQLHPLLPSNKLTKAQVARVVAASKSILQQAILQGGTTIKDFQNSQGKPGYFAQQLKVYGRAEQSCVNCATVLTEIRIAGRSTVFCSHCQRLA